MSEIIPHKLIVFEGIDGSGKTTVSKMLFDYMKEKNLPVTWLREPSDSNWGKKIREISRFKTSIPLEEELHYFIEDRKLNVSHNIKPALSQNKTVILDRYYYSTACYQGARGMNMNEIIQMNRKFAPEPDITFIIDVDVNIGMNRIKKSRNSRVKLFEKKKFLKKVRKNYLALTGENIHIIDGSQDLKTILKRITEILGL
jgi:dTMP kinase